MRKAGVSEKRSISEIARDAKRPPAGGPGPTNGVHLSDNAFKSHFANFAALTNALSQAGANATIKLAANDVVTLINVSTQSLNAS